MPRSRLLASLGFLGILAALGLVATLAARAAIDALWPYALRPGPAQHLATLIVRRHSVADLLAYPTAPGQTVEVDAYFSGASALPADGGQGAATQAPGAVDWKAVLSDLPFLPELSVLGRTLANALPDSAPWLVVSLPKGATLPPSGLPYCARFRGHLVAAPAANTGAATARIFVVDRIVRIHAQHPPAAPSAVASHAVWPRYSSSPSRAGYSLPQPPGWQVEQEGDAALTLRDPQWPDNPITLRVHPGETHYDPYDPAATPPLLREEKWGRFQQGSPLGPAIASAHLMLSGYRIERQTPSGDRSTSVLFSANGRTYELSVSYPLGFAAPQPVLTAYAAIVSGFRLDLPARPAAAPPVRQALGAGPFLKEEDILGTTCRRLDGQIEAYAAQLVPEAQARRRAAQPLAFTGHYDGIWEVTVRTPLAARTEAMRMLFDATTGRELYKQEVDSGEAPERSGAFTREPADPIGVRPAETRGRDTRWVEVNLAEQTTIAWEGDVPVRRMLISSGVAQHPTITGKFHVYLKTVSQTMQGPGYNLPNVPYCLFFYDSYGLHGTYWHTNFGTPMSHGCVNLSRADAAWLFDWTTPHVREGSWGAWASPCDPGTIVVVH